MHSFKKSFWILICLTIFCMTPNGKAYADVFATSEMSLSSLGFSTNEPNAALVWRYSEFPSTWYGDVRTHAQYTGFGTDDDFAYLLADNGNIMEQSNAPNVISRSTYALVNGQSVGTSADASIGATTFSNLNFNEQGAQGDGDAISNFNNYFMITKIDPSQQGDDVAVTFLLDAQGRLDGVADKFGFFSTALAGSLQLWDNAQMLGNDIISDIHAGTNTEFHQPYNGTLEIDALLKFDTQYWLYAEADSEVYGANAVPEPDTFILVLAGGSLLLWRMKAKRKRTMK